MARAVAVSRTALNLVAFSTAKNQRRNRAELVLAIQQF
jgi:hypothetical protein